MSLSPIDPEWPFATSDEYTRDEWEVTECNCRTCECYEPAEPEAELCLGCLHGAHPGEQE